MKCSVPLKILALVSSLSFAALPAQSADDVAAKVQEARAVQAAIWGMPAVNYDLMLQEMLAKTRAKVGEVVYWGRPLDWHNQTLTPNPDAIYFMSFYNTKDGPIVLDLPSGNADGSFNGNICTIWQMPLEDAGLLGADKGAGGKYLVLPPGYKGTVPAGYIPLQSDTFGGFILLRSNLKSHDPADVERSIAYGKRMKVYPLAQAANPRPTVFTDAKDVLFDSTIRYDATFFDHLNRIVQSEPWLPRDRAMISQLQSIGIEKGKPFKPDAATTAMLNRAAQEAHRYLADMYDKGWPSYFDKTQWRAAAPAEVIKMQVSNYADNDAYPVDMRAMSYSYGYVGLKRLGPGQFYLIALRDKTGAPLDGAKTYRLNVPANVPVKQYWSVTAYDRDTHALILNMSRASRSSQVPDLKKNVDGSVDIYFGPKAPAGKEGNWVPTDPKHAFELMFRLYGPTQALFDKAWTLNDPEQTAAN